MSDSTDYLGRLTAFTILALMLVPALAAAVPLPSEQPQDSLDVVDERTLLWWENTNMDLDQDRVHDAIWVAPYSTHYDYVDDAGRISVIVDFDHEPNAADEQMLEREVGFETQFRYWLIHSIAGRVDLDRIDDIVSLPGVVFVELDGRLEVLMNDVKPTHGVDLVWQDTGYTGAGITMAIIDTGIDGNHSGIDDLDDDNSTHDPKILGFYDAINNPDKTNGTEVEPYDDHGHGSHCAGITTGTGAPTYEYIGIAPQANLVGVKVLSGSGSGSYAQVMAGMQWTVDKRHDFNIRAASMSLGGPAVSEWTTSEQESVNRMANEMMRAGVALFIAAGNAAFSAQIGTPGSAEDVITVGALDKNTAIAVYSSQGPTEEGRIKPNLAFVGSSVMSVEANTGTGYTAMSGTSMATPGAAGVAVLMYQANPDLSPFDIRNIMQETSTYRQCHYMAANEPCAEDAIPKNRQNNVYGHGHVNAQPAVEEAANRVYELNLALNITLSSEIGDDNRVHVDQGGSVAFAVEGGAMRIQWRTWDMRDNWMNLADFEAGDEQFEVTHSLLVDRLQFLPNNTIEGDQVILVRAIKDDQASTNLAINIHLMGEEKAVTTDSGGSFMGLLVGLLALFVLVLLAALTFAGVQLRERGYFDDDDDYDEEMDEAIESIMSEDDSESDDGD
jgi:subtilisin family serine protease